MWQRFIKPSKGFIGFFETCFHKIYLTNIQQYSEIVILLLLTKVFLRIQNEIEEVYPDRQSSKAENLFQKSKLGYGKE